jgi:Flp pilus assembly protein TadD
VANKLEALAHGYRLIDHRPDFALQQAAEILKQYPNDSQTYCLLSAARRASGDKAGGLEAERLAVTSASADRELVLAAGALVDNDIPLAERTLKRRLRANPFDFPAMRLLAEVAARLGRFADSEKILRNTLMLAPGFTEARINLAQLLNKQNRAPEAAALLDEMEAAGDLTDNAAHRRASILGRVGRYEEAIAEYRTSLTRTPKEARLWTSLGHMLKTVGNRDDSIAAYRKASELRPAMGEAWWSLANLKTVAFEEADRAAMDRALQSSEADDSDRCHLHFALGKYHEDRREDEAAWAHYDAGNRLRAADVRYDRALDTELVDRSIAMFDRAFFAARSGQGDPTPDPIFVVGMPRAGSTLIEQILASHSQVEGTMELPDIIALARSVGERRAENPAERYPDAIADLDAAALRRLGESYLERTRVQRIQGKPFFIDKMPNNWQHVGLIRLILPNAKVIDARRNPLDCGFSNFKQHYAIGQAFSYDLTDFGTYYANYVRLMAHMDDVQPGAVHRVIHERLLDDPESEVRALLAYCGLPFEDGCLRFYENKRAVRTPSSEQVRQPLNRKAVDRWRRFERWLNPLKTALGPVLDRWDDAPRP